MSKRPWKHLWGPYQDWKKERKKDKPIPRANDGAGASTWPLSLTRWDITPATARSTLPFQSQLLGRQLDYGMLFKVLVAFVVLTGCCCWAARIRRQEDGEFWWLNKEKAAVKEDAELVPEVKINAADESKTANIKQGTNSTDSCWMLYVLNVVFDI